MIVNVRGPYSWAASGTDGGVPDASNDSKPDRRSERARGSGLPAENRCVRPTFSVEKGMSRADVRAVRRALHLVRSEVLVSMRYANRRHTRIEVTTNFGTECISGGGIYTFTLTKSGWRSDGTMGLFNY